MAVVKVWTKEELEELLDLVDEKGQAEAIREFSEKSGRSTDACRRKLNHYRSMALANIEDVDQFESQIETSEEDLPEVVVDPRFASDEDDTPSLLKRIWNWILRR